jgi:hypothetical protein
MLGYPELWEFFICRLLREKGPEPFWLGNPEIWEYFICRNM